MRRVFFALLAELIPAVAFMVLGGMILTQSGGVAGDISRLMAGAGLSQPTSGWLLIAAGTASVVATVVHLYPLVRQFWMQKALSEDGVCVRGVVTDIKNSRVFRVNQTYPVRLTICCTAPSGRETDIVSPILWAPNMQLGEGADVVFDPQDEERYFIRLLEKKVVRNSLKEQPNTIFRRR